jgi:hypothetical protein
MFQDSNQQKVLSKLRAYRDPLHSDFGWWKEKPYLTSDEYRCLGPLGDDSVVPPQELLRTLDQFESLLNWLETTPIVQGMTANEKAKLALKLLDITSTRDLSVSSGPDSFNVNLEGDSRYPVRVQVEGKGRDILATL